MGDILAQPPIPSSSPPAARYDDQPPAIDQAYTLGAVEARWAGPFTIGLERARSPTGIGRIGNSFPLFHVNK